jgi:hypothetical protein
MSAVGAAVLYGNGDLARLVVYEDVRPSPAGGAHGYAVRDGLESIAARKHVPDGEERRDLDISLAGVSIEGCPVLKPLLPAKAVAVAETVTAAARPIEARIVRALMSPLVVDRQV